MAKKKHSFRTQLKGDQTIYMISPYEDEDLSGYDYPEAAYMIGPDGEILGSYGDDIQYDDDGNIIIGNDDISDYIEPIILDDDIIPLDYLDERLLNDERNRILLRRQGGVFSKGGSIINNNMGLYKRGGYLMPRKFQHGGANGRSKDDNQILIDILGLKNGDYEKGYKGRHRIDDQGYFYQYQINPELQDTIVSTTRPIWPYDDPDYGGYYSISSTEANESPEARKEYEARKKMVGKNIGRPRSHSKGGIAVKVDRGNGIEGYALANREDINWVRNQEGRYVPQLKEFAKGGRVGKFQKGTKTPNKKQIKKQMMPFMQTLTPEQVKELEDRDKQMQKIIDRDLQGKTMGEIMDEWVKKGREATKRELGPDGVITPSSEYPPLPNAIVGEEPNIVLYQEGDKMQVNNVDYNDFMSRIRSMFEQQQKIKDLDNIWRKQEESNIQGDQFSQSNVQPNVVEGTEQSGNTQQSGLFNGIQRRLQNNNR